MSSRRRNAGRRYFGIRNIKSIPYGKKRWLHQYDDDKNEIIKRLYKKRARNKLKSEIKTILSEIENEE